MITSQFKTNDFGNALAGENDRVMLPFGTLRLPWHNGNPQAEKSGAKYFGGWFSSDDNPDFLSDLAIVNQDAAPQGFTGPEIWTARDGKEYTAYSARRVFAAPIATRVKWMTNKETGKKNSSTSLLVYLADWDVEKKCLIPYAPAVLSAKGFAGNFILDAFKKWQADTARIRLEIARGVPSNLFYVPVGTFGKERITKMVGSGNSQSPVVPVQVGNPPQGWDNAEVEKHFVGDDIAAIMKSLKEQAAEWLSDKSTEDVAPAQVAPSAREPRDSNRELAGPDCEDDFPF